MYTQRKQFISPKDKAYGFVKPKIEYQHHVFGSIFAQTKDILQDDGQWDKYLPIYEPQAENYETYGCTVWGTENAVEILEKKITNTEPNYSERYIYNLDYIREPGGDPHVVAETIRKYGMIAQESLGMALTYDEFTRPYPMSRKYLSEGGKWLKRWDFGHEWVFTNDTDRSLRIERMKQCLKYSPLGVSVTAWFEEDGIYVDHNMPNNHWCVCYGYTESNGQIFWKIFDSYDHSIKMLHPNHDIEFCKRYSLKPAIIKDSPFMAFIKKLIHPHGNI